MGGKDDDEDPTDIDVEKYKLDAVKDSVLETVEACNEESRENTDAETAGRKLALKQCREATAKKEIADVTGKPENDITPTDIRRTIKHATKSRIRDVLKEVEKIPKSSKKKKKKKKKPLCDPPPKKKKKKKKKKK